MASVKNNKKDITKAKIVCSSKVTMKGDRYKTG